jgi:hypothetical protein
MKLLFLWLSSALVLLISLQKLTFAAACCGGGFASPAIIAGDDKAQVTLSIAQTRVIIDSVDSTGIWRKSDVHQQVQVTKLEAAHILSDRFQLGTSIPVIERKRDSVRYSGLGDISTSMGYEFLPDWNYHPWRPKGIGFLQLIIPTGQSKADSEVGGLDSRGNGFWALGAGTLLTKTWSRLDSFLSFDIHRSHAKRVSNSQFSGQLEPGWGGNFGLGVGFNNSNYRFGSSLTWTYEDPIKTTSDFGTRSDGSVERYATGLLSVSYLASDEWSGTVSFSDQTFFGSPINTSLGRSFAFQLQRRWGR